MRITKCNINQMSKTWLVLQLVHLKVIEANTKIFLNM